MTSRWARRPIRTHSWKDKRLKICHVQSKHTKGRGPARRRHWQYSWQNRPTKCTMPPNRIARTMWYGTTFPVSRNLEYISGKSTWSMLLVTHLVYLHSLRNLSVYKWYSFHTLYQHNQDWRICHWVKLCKSSHSVNIVYINNTYFPVTDDCIYQKPPWPRQRLWPLLLTQSPWQREQDLRSQFPDYPMR